MYLIVNNQELTVNNAYTERDINTNTLTAVIEVPYSVDFVALKTLFMENTGIITKVSDDGSTESWDGFAYNKPPIDDGEQYRIVLLGNENTYQIERLRYLEQVLAEKENKLSSMEYTLTEKDSVIAEKESKIAEQEEMIVAKDVMISEQSAKISEKDTTIMEQSALIEEQKTDIENKEMVLAENETTITQQGTTIATQEEEITQLRQTLEVKTAELVSKEEEVLTLAEQCADLLYMSSLKEIETIESEVIAE